MAKICTSIEQSKKLLELGIDRKTSDMYYWCGEDLRIGGHKAQDEELDIPAWSLTALLELLSFPNLFYNDGWNLYVTINDKIVNINNANNPIDAAFEMIVWLKENGKI